MDVRTPIPTNGGNWLSQFGETWKTQIEQLKQKFGPAIQEVRMPGDYPTDMPIIFVQRDSIVDVSSFIKGEPGFEYGFLSDITATDEESDLRFEVVYHFYAPTRGWRIRLKTRVAESEQVPTLSTVWPGANWAEREVFDMFGVKFKGHPDLRRILMDERWQGHPLRKDYPIRGYQIYPSPELAHEDLLE